MPPASLRPTSSSGGRSVAVVSSGVGGSSRRSARTAVSATRRLRIDLGPEDEPVLGQEQQRVDFLGVEGPASGRGRRDYPKLDLRVVEWLRRPVEGGGEAGRRRRRHRDPVGLLWIRQSAKQRRDADQRKDESGRREERLAAQPLRSSRSATSMIALRQLMAPPAR